MGNRGRVFRPRPYLVRSWQELGHTAYFTPCQPLKRGDIVSDTRTPRAVGYIRVSDESQIENTSLSTQEKFITAYAKNKGYNLIKIYADEGESARTTKNRDAFQAMKADAGRHRFDVLIVMRFDRLMRNRRSADENKRTLRDSYHIKIFSCTEQGEDDNEAAWMGENIADLLAEHYSRELSKKIKWSRQEIFERGLYWGANRPFGFANDVPTYLTPHPVEAPILREIFEKYSTGKWSYKDLCNELNERKVKTTLENSFEPQAIKRIVHNKLYIGIITRSDTLYDADMNKSFGAKTEGKGAHEPLISTELFEKVQQVASSRKMNIQATPVEWQHKLNGLCFCSECTVNGEEPEGMPLARWGKLYTYHDVRTLKNGTIGTYNYYRCRGKHKAAPMKELEKQVIDWLLDPRMLEQWKTGGFKVVLEGIEYQDIEQRIAEIRAIMRRQDDRYDMGFIIDREEYIAKRQALQAELEQLNPPLEDAYERAVDFVENFPKYWLETGDDVAKQKALIRRVVERVYVLEGRLEGIVMKPDQRFIIDTRWDGDVWQPDTGVKRTTQPSK